MSSDPVKLAMSEWDDGVYVSTYCGPERRDGKNRLRVQLFLKGYADGAGDLVSMSVEQAQSLRKWLKKVLPEREKRSKT